MPRKPFIVLLAAVSVLALLVGVATPQSDDADASRRPAITTIPVLAHFMNWATVPGGWFTVGSLPLRRDNPLGGYDSRDRAIIDAQNAEMLANGIVPCVSWWARDTYAGDPFLDLYLTIPGPKVCILYEAVGPGRMSVVNDGINIGDPANAEIFISDMAHLQEKYFARYPDRFFRIDGRPAVFIWITHAFDGPFDQVIARARERSSFFLVGSDFDVPFGPRPGLAAVVRGMDAVSSYGFYNISRYGVDMPKDFLTDYQRSIPSWVGWLSVNAKNTRLLLPMQFSYDDSRIPGRRGLIFRSTPETAWQYAQMVRGLITDPCASRVLPVAYITSYNEHYETTAVEPHEVSKEDAQRGFIPSTYLDILRTTFLSVPSVAGSPRDCDSRDRGNRQDR